MHITLMAMPFIKPTGLAYELEVVYLA